MCTSNLLIIAQSFLLCSALLRCRSAPKSFAVFDASLGGAGFLSFDAGFFSDPARCPRFLIEILRL